MATEIVVPALGESVTTATVARWIKQQGETVAADEPLVELETDKVTVEVNAPSAGVLSSIGVPEGTEVEVGAVLGVVDGAGGAAAPKPAAARARAAPCRQPAGRHQSAAASAGPGVPAGRVRTGACAIARRGEDARGKQGLGERPRHRHRQGRPHHQGRRDRVSVAPGPGAPPLRRPPKPRVRMNRANSA